LRLPPVPYLPWQAMELTGLGLLGACCVALAAASGEAVDAIGAVQLNLAVRRSAQEPQELEQPQEPQGPFSPLADALAKSMTDVYKQAAASDDRMMPKSSASVLDMSWERLQIAADTNATLMWHHGCDGGEKPTGTCHFNTADKQNSMWLVLNSITPVEDDARLKLSMDISVFGTQKNVAVDCVICGKPCDVSPPIGKPFSVPMPNCPFPMGDKMPMPSIDLSFVPTFAKFKMDTDYGITRANGDYILNMKFTESV